MDLAPVQILWIGSALSVVERLCVKSFLANKHPVHLYTYGNIDNIPEGTIVMDANEIIASHEIFTIESGWGKGSYTAFANLFRYKLLLERGGWWFDTDIICLKPLDITEQFLIGSSYENKWGVCANNCVLRAEKGNPLLQRLYDNAKAIGKENLKFGQTGVHLLQRLVKEMGLEGNMAPYYYFNPLSWHNIGYYLLGQKGPLKNHLKEAVRPLFKPGTMKGRRVTKESYTVHFWNEVWRKKGFDKNATYPPDSLFETLKRKYQV